MKRERRSSEEMYGISEAAMHELAQYNGEVARGLVHTPKWAERMSVLQERYNQTRRGDPKAISTDKWSDPFTYERLDGK